MLKLMNSAMMPQEGSYYIVKIDKQTFCDILKTHFDKQDVESFIGYPDVIDLIHKWTGIKLPVSREQTKLKSYDKMLIIKLKYRVNNPADKGKFTPSENDYEFFLCNYIEITMEL